MKAWIGTMRNQVDDGAILIFASNHREARRVAWPHLQEWCMDFIDMRVRMLRNLPDHLKVLNTGVPQAIDSPPHCKRCETWGGHRYEDGKCSECVDDDNCEYQG